MNTLDVLKEHLVQALFCLWPSSRKKSRTSQPTSTSGRPRRLLPGVYHFYSVANSVTFVCGDRLMQVDCNLDFKAKEVIKEMRQRTNFPSTASS